MSLRDLTFKSSYETLEEDPVREFYIPVLEESVSYDRIAGFFSSTSLALAARGVLGLIKNNGHMRLVVSPRLSEEDLQIIREAEIDPQGVIEDAMIRDIEELGKSLKDDHVRALGWMLARGYLELRIALVVDDEEKDTGALFHQKVGIFRDEEGNEVSFSGSINETASGWLLNAEEFKVFSSWDAGCTYLHDDKLRFEELWSGRKTHTRIYRPSESFTYQFVKLGDDFEPEHLAMRQYEKEKRREEARDAISLFSYQRDAVEAWEAAGRRMLFEMATGTGKTRTAIACVNIAKAESDKFVCIVAAPEITLARQWLGEFEDLGVAFEETVFADSSSGGKAKWHPSIKSALAQMRIGIVSSLLVMTTHATASSVEFVDLFSKLTDDIDTCFVGDEVHGLGSIKQRAALDSRYEFRIGLSATPARWFDLEGAQCLETYFGSASFKFGIKQAQNTVNPLTGRPFLTPYEYVPILVSLDREEMDDYLQLSEKISKLSHMDDEESKERLEMLAIRRADITKNAVAKMTAFEEIVCSECQSQTLVFASPQQIDEVCKVLARNRIVAHPFTMKQGTRKKKEFGGLSEREYLLKEFAAGTYQTLVAISCLDEGIDVPSAQTAILLSNSTNPREYIQRIGRVIRYCKGKEMARVIDFVVEPDWDRFKDPDLKRQEARVFKNELRRIQGMAENASNKVDIAISINERLERVCDYE